MKERRSVADEWSIRASGKRIVVGLALVVLVAFGPHPWRARALTNRFVSTSGNDMGGTNDCTNSGQPCATIQNAINHSVTGDFIQLGPGTFFEDVIVNQNVTIQGDSTVGTTVNGSNAGSVFTVQFFVTAAGLSTLTITNGSGSPLNFASGGGIFNAGKLIVTGCTITGNQAPNAAIAGFGGGIANFQGNLTLINSTINRNMAASGGGGLFNDSGSIATVVNSTISDNSAGSNGGGIRNDPNGTLNLTNTIIAGSLSGGDCVNNGTVGTNDKSLIQDGSCGPAISGDPKLGSLQNNGGPTFTQALLPGSPAIDAGDDSVVGSPFNLTTDQRGPGFPRKSGLHVDIGAFEAPPFTTCLRDNSTGNLLQWNSTTGAYKFTRCSDGFMITGTGVVKLVNGIQTLTDFKTDRRISAGFNTGQLTGNATIYLMVAQGVWQSFQIVDTNPNAVCACPG